MLAHHDDTVSVHQKVARERWDDEQHHEQVLRKMRQELLIAIADRGTIPVAQLRTRIKYRSEMFGGASSDVSPQEWNVIEVTMSVGVRLASCNQPVATD